MRLLPLLTLTCALSGAALAQPNIAPPNPPENQPVPAPPNPPENQPVPAPPVIRPRPGTAKEQIEADLKGFFAALNTVSGAPSAEDFTIPLSISGSRIGYFGLSEWRSYFAAERGKTQYRLDQIDFLAQDNDTARVKIFYSLLTPNNVAPAAGQPALPEVGVANEEETLDLKREIISWQGSEKWRIVPPSFDTLGRYRPLSLSHIAYFGSQREGTLPQLRAEISLNRLKQMALGAIQFTQDYDEIFLFQNDFWREAITPYVRSESIFLIPGTQTPYTFNDNLSAKNLADVKEIAQTVLFYEGENERPTFRYNGQAAICFVDGHVKLVSPEAAKSLIWKP